MPDPGVSVKLLGPPAVYSVDGRIRLPDKVLGLLARVLCDASRRHSRHELARLFWPDAGGRAGRHSLSQALYIIKNRLGPEALESTGEYIKAGGLHSDVGVFNASLAQSDWLRAAQVYSGQLLSQLALKASAEFEHWLDVERMALAKAAQEVAEQLHTNGQVQAAGELAETLLTDDPENQILIRAVVQGKFESAGFGEAKRFADSLSAPLSSIAGETLAGCRDGAPGATAVVVNSAFVGRKSAMAWLEDRFAEAKAGSPNGALIEGEAGIGKTALVERFSRLLTIRGARVLAAVAYSAEQNVPFGVVGQWLQDLTPEELDGVTDQPWLRVLGASFPALVGDLWASPAKETEMVGHHRLLESLRRLLVHLSGRRPLLLVVDDMQWADPASLSFIHYSQRRGGSEPILYLGALRSERDPEMKGLEGWDKLHRFRLSGLSIAEVEQLTESPRSRTGVSQGVNAEFLHRQTGGNPLLISIMLQEWTLRPTRAAGPPESIVEFIKPRLENRSEVARRLLGALSLLGEPCRQSRAAGVAGLTEVEAANAMTELSNALLITDKDKNVTLRHGLVGEVALSMLSAAEKQQMHGRAARDLATSGTSPNTLVAVSHDLAGNRADAFEASLQASKACDILHARTEKEFFLKLALSNAPSPTDEARVRIELGGLYIRQRRPSDAMEVLDLGSAAEVPAEVRTRAEVTRLRAMADMTGDIEVLGDLWNRARTIGAGLPILSVADMYTDIAGVAHELGLEGIAAEIARRIERDLEDLPLTVATAHHLLRPIAIIGLHNGYRTALARLKELPSPEEGDPTYATSYFATKATILVAQGSLVEAERLFAKSIGLTERYALFDHLYTINNNLGVCLMEQGRHNEARRLFNTAVEYATADVSPSHHSTARDNLTILAFEQADYEQAIENGEKLLAARRIAGARTAMSVLAIVGLSSLEVGDLSRCREAERELLILTQRHGEFSNDMSYAHVFMSRMMALRGAREAAVKRLSRAADHYRDRNLLASIRLDLERWHVLMRLGRDCRPEIRSTLEVIGGTRATPLIERTTELLGRAERQFA